MCNRIFPVASTSSTSPYFPQRRPQRLRATGEGDTGAGEANAGDPYSEGWQQEATADPEASDTEEEEDDEDLNFECVLIFISI